MGLLKVLREGEDRYVAKIYSGTGKHAVWGVYDRAMASWPGNIIGYGRVPQAPLNEADATEHARRINDMKRRMEALTS